MAYGCAHNAHSNRNLRFELAISSIVGSIFNLLIYLPLVCTREMKKNQSIGNPQLPPCRSCEFAFVWCEEGHIIEWIISHVYDDLSICTLERHQSPPNDVSARACEFRSTLSHRIIDGIIEWNSGSTICGIVRRAQCKRHRWLTCLDGKNIHFCKVSSVHASDGTMARAIVARLIRNTNKHRTKQKPNWIQK